MPLYGTDVASYQGNVDWARVHTAGIRFGFSKVTQSTNYGNPTWSHNRSGMLALGADFLPGAYHFLTDGTDPAAQARYFLQHAGDVSGLAVALDVEPTKGSRPTAAQARAWVAEFKRLTGGHPVIGYFPGWYHNELGRPDLTFFDTLWQSHYVSGSGPASGLYAKAPTSWWAAYGGEPVSILQFSSSGSVPGIPGDCDVNAYQGTVEQLRALALGTPQPAPQEEDSLKTVVDLGSKVAQTIPAGARRSLLFETEWADPDKIHTDTKDGTAYPSLFPAGGDAPYEVTVEVILAQRPAPGVDLTFARYQRKTNDLEADIRGAELVGKRETLHSTIRMSKDHKYRADIVNNSGAPVVVQQAYLIIAH